MNLTGIRGWGSFWQPYSAYIQGKCMIILITLKNGIGGYHGFSKWYIKKIERRRWWTWIGRSPRTPLEPFRSRGAILILQAVPRALFNEIKIRIFIFLRWRVFEIMCFGFTILMFLIFVLMCFSNVLFWILDLQLIINIVFNFCVDRLFLVWWTVIMVFQNGNYGTWKQWSDDRGGLHVDALPTPLYYFELFRQPNIYDYFKQRFRKKRLIGGYHGVSKWCIKKLERRRWRT